MGTRVGRDPRSREPVDAVVVGHGSESEVFSPGDGTVRKVRLLRPYGIDAVLDDLAKIVYHNYLFPADAYVVNGVLVYDNAGRDEYFLDLSQPLVLPLRDENGFTAAPSEEQILAAQGGKIDGVSGATLTSMAVKEAYADVLAQAGLAG